MKTFVDGTELFPHLMLGSMLRRDQVVQLSQLIVVHRFHCGLVKGRVSI